MLRYQKTFSTLRTRQRLDFTMMPWMVWKASRSGTKPTMLALSTLTASYCGVNAKSIPRSNLRKPSSTAAESSCSGKQSSLSSELHDTGLSEYTKGSTMDPENMLPENYSSECIGWFKGTIVEDYFRSRDVVEDMAKDYFKALDRATFQKKDDTAPCFRGQIVAITRDTKGIQVEEARRRLLALCEKRGLKPVTGKVYFQPRACYMEAK
jgi:hypothetical protein